MRSRALAIACLVARGLAFQLELGGGNFKGARALAEALARALPPGLGSGLEACDAILLGDVKAPAAHART